MEHANITVDNIADTKRFLMTAFPHFKVRGGQKTDHGDWQKEWIHLGTDEIYIALEEVTLEPTGSRTRHEDPGINHIGIVVDDIDELATRLKDYQVGEMMVEGDGPGRKRFYVHDGAGCEWEFIQYLTKDSDKAHEYLD
jgi:hypothetical protein